MTKLQQNGQSWVKVVFDGPEDMLPLMKQYYGIEAVVLDDGEESNTDTNPTDWPIDWLFVTILEWNDE